MVKPKHLDSRRNIFLKKFGWFYRHCNLTLFAEAAGSTHLHSIKTSVPLWLTHVCPTCVHLWETHPVISTLWLFYFFKSFFSRKQVLLSPSWREHWPPTVYITVVSASTKEFVNICLLLFPIIILIFFFFLFLTNGILDRLYVNACLILFWY